MQLRRVRRQAAGGGAGLQVQIHEARQHQQRADHGVEKKLERNGYPPHPAPGPGQEINRNQGHLPEEVKQERIQGHKHAQQPGLHEQYQRVKRRRVFVVAPKGREQNQRHQKRRQQHQGQAQPIQPNVKVNARRGYPIQIQIERLRTAGLKLEGGKEGKAQFGEGGPQGQSAGRATFGKMQQQRSRQG